MNKLESLEMDLEAAAYESQDDNTHKVLKGVGELRTYVERNRQFLPNYGERYRNGERIATGFVESAVNQVVSKRMVKLQQMRWSHAALICCCKSARGCSMKSGRRRFDAGIQASGQKPRNNRFGRLLDPPESNALRSTPA